ncbi:MAG: hypothetical protein M1825_002509 [Sarcosagium campestre]|nr:MAG: hypothetical protein M1825_002509 [Sarcosagium campestre]
MSSSTTKKTAYGTATNDAARRTWDRDAYAEKAAVREAAEREEGKARYEAKMAGKKYYAPGPNAADQQLTDARASRLDVAAHVGRVQIISGAQAAVGKRGRGAGFYCDACDLTFKDNLQWVEHLNSRQHLVATGESGEVKRATLEEVRQRLVWLKQKRDEEARDTREDLGERLRLREEEDAREREERRERRREKRRKAAAGAGNGVAADPVPVDGPGQVGGDDDGDDGQAQTDEADEMAAMMGFGGFGSTKV